MRPVKSVLSSGNGVRNQVGNLSGHAAVNKPWELPTPNLSGRMTPQIIFPKKVIEVKTLRRQMGPVRFMSRKT